MYITRTTTENQQGLFPELLHCLLDDCEKNDESNIVSWGRDGQSFKVHQKDEFTKKILPRYFRQSRYKSFVRQLNIWGFSCVTNGPDKGYYYHPQFVRGQSVLCTLMKRRQKQRAIPLYKRPLSCLWALDSPRSSSTSLSSFIDERTITTLPCRPSVQRNELFPQGHLVAPLDATISPISSLATSSQSPLVEFDGKEKDLKRKLNLSEDIFSIQETTFQTKESNTTDDWLSYLETEFDTPPPPLPLNERVIMQTNQQSSFLFATRNYNSYDETHQNCWSLMDMILEPRPLRIDIKNQELARASKNWLKGCNMGESPTLAGL